MEESLSVIAEVIEKYQTSGAISSDNLIVMLRRLTIHNYKLSEYNVEYYNDHNAILYSHAGSVARAKIEADNEVPELRQTRKIMDAVDNVMWSMRSELSIIKSENKNN